MVCFLSMMRRFYSLAFITALFAGTLPFGYASPAEDDLTRAAADELIDLLAASSPAATLVTELLGAED